jgi:RNA polymerase-binding protein DksA
MDSDTQTHLKTLRDMLVYRLSELRADVHAAQLAREAQGQEAAGGEVADQKDRAAEWLRVEVSEAEAQRDLHELAQVEQALQRLDAGRYGDCLRCGQPIALQRLLAQPAASRCAACQADAERLHAAA